MSEQFLNPLEAAVSGVGLRLEEQLAAIGKRLSRYPVTDRDVHEIRKAIKRARATLRLLRPAVGEQRFRADNMTLRDIARPLSRVRDARILPDALDKLCKHAGARARLVPRNAIRRLLTTELAVTIADSSATGHATSAYAHKRLEAMARRYAASPPEDEPHTIVEGLRQVYKSGRSLMATARASRSAGDLHEWRKITKYVWHELHLLTPLRPGAMRRLAGRAQRLSAYLGDEHDLAVLREKLEQHAVLFTTVRQQRETVALIEQRRAKLQDKAFAVGPELYRLAPHDFARTLAGWWSDKRLRVRRSPPARMQTHAKRRATQARTALRGSRAQGRKRQ